MTPRNTQTDGNREKPRAWLVVSLIVLLIGGGIFYYFFDPMDNRWMPQCVFHRLTGLQCMGCGSQRMVHALLHGDIAGAFMANIFGMVMLPVILFMIWAETQRLRRPGLNARLFSPAVVYTLIALMVVWLIVRNIIGI